MCATGNKFCETQCLTKNKKLKNYSNIYFFNEFTKRATINIKVNFNYLHKEQLNFIHLYSQSSSLAVTRFEKKK